ncbi:MAG TPA: Hpt domain-containing protein [Thermoanaerobaculia bacterium]|nr:Hpt domain-containing protein [Thermoanaerobaculia bacterium]
MVVDHELNELRREFLDEAREKVVEMQGALDALDGEALERVAYLAHQLKGSGGSYGYQRISTDAAELEKCVESSSPDETRIQQFVVSLRGEIDRAAKELG